MLRAFYLAIVVLALVGLCQPAYSQEKTVSIGFQKIPGPWLRSVLNGAFERATGYDITWKRISTGKIAIDSLARDSVQIVYAGSSPIAAGLSAGHDIELFWIAADIHLAEGLVVRNGSGIREPQDLKGKRIGVPFGSTSHFHLIYALEQFTIPTEWVGIRNMPPHVIQSSWDRGDIDAAFVWAPTLGTLMRSGKVLISSGVLRASGA